MRAAGVAARNPCRARRAGAAKPAWLRHAAALGLAASLLACSETPPPERAPRPVIVMTVAAGASGATFAYPGEVRSRYEADLAFRLGGKLVERRVNAGEAVRKGQVLARLDAADAALSEQSTRAQLAAAEADLALARADFERAQALVAQKFLAPSALDARRSQFEAAQARVAQARAQRATSHNQVGYTTLVAERDGVISSVSAEAGQVVAAGQPVMRMADPAQREILIWIPEGRETGLKIGQPALVRAWSAPERTYHGVLRELAASADTATRTYAARVAVQDADAALGLGASAGVGFVQQTPQGAPHLTLPLSAVLRDEGQGAAAAARVWVIGEDGKLATRAVQVIAWRDTEAVLGGGLKPGERVVVVGAHALSAGEAVRPVERGAPVTLDIQR